MISQTTMQYCYFFKSVTVLCTAETQIREQQNIPSASTYVGVIHVFLCIPLSWIKCFHFFTVITWSGFGRYL